MLIGIPREIKNHEYRVGMTPVRCARWSRTVTGHRRDRRRAGIGCTDEVCKRRRRKHRQQRRRGLCPRADDRQGQRTAAG